LNLATVVEGVESHVELQMLEHCACDFFQGFRFAPPMTFEKLVPWMEGYVPAATPPVTVLKPAAFG